MAEFYEARIAGVRLYIASLDTDAPRDLVKHRPVSGDDVEVDDRGRGEHTTDVELLFATMPGETQSPKARFDAFNALVNKGNGAEGYYFTHPVEGTYRVAIGAFRYSLRNGVIRATATFTRVGTIEAVVPIGPSVSPEAGLEAVTAAADAATAALDDVDLESDVPAEAVATATRWADPDVSARAVFLEVGSASKRIQGEIDALDLVSDLLLWPAYRALIELQHALAGAADAATAEVANVFSLLIERPTPLRAICARVARGTSTSAEDLYAQVMRLNDVATPARIPTGTTLIVPVLATQQRAG